MQPEENAPEIGAETDDAPLAPPLESAPTPSPTEGSAVGEEVLRLEGLELRAAPRDLRDRLWGRAGLTIDSLRLARGQMLLILSPRASELSDLLLAMAGLQSVRSGSVLLRGTPVARVPRPQRDIGFGFADGALIESLTIAENLAFALRAKQIPLPERRAHAAAMLERMGMAALADMTPDMLSLADRRALGCARALMAAPSLILLDRSLDGVEPRARAALIAEIGRQKQSGAAIVLCAQDGRELLGYADRVMVVHEGAVRQSGDPRHLYDEPASSVVARLLGPCNVLPAMMEEARGGLLRARLIDGKAVLARQVGALEPGEPCELMLRPEDVVVQPRPGGLPCRLEAQVVDILFQGNHLQVRLRVAETDDFNVLLPVSVEASLPARGESLTIGWAARDCRAVSLARRAPVLTEKHEDSLLAAASGAGMSAAAPIEDAAVQVAAAQAEGDQAQGAAPAATEPGPSDPAVTEPKIATAAQNAPGGSVGAPDPSDPRPEPALTPPDWSRLRPSVDYMDVRKYMKPVDHMDPVPAATGATDDIPAPAPIGSGDSEPAPIEPVAIEPEPVVPEPLVSDLGETEPAPEAASDAASLPPGELPESQEPDPVHTSSDAASDASAPVTKPAPKISIKLSSTNK
ncbi:MAG: TOBE domain-containing protein [Neomegalonema sp.]|nr:TOBE domain-containing protein [Neomegalonema sp.]